VERESDDDNGNNNNNNNNDNGNNNNNNNNKNYDDSAKNNYCKVNLIVLVQNRVSWLAYVLLAFNLPVQNQNLLDTEMVCSLILKEKVFSAGI
jgi:hypothetical protein